MVGSDLKARFFFASLNQHIPIVLHIQNSILIARQFKMNCSVCFYSSSQKHIYGNRTIIIFRYGRVIRRTNLYIITSFVSIINIVTTTCH